MLLKKLLELFLGLCGTRVLQPMCSILGRDEWTMKVRNNAIQNMGNAKRAKPDTPLRL
jgi:hypothetical protein